MGTAPRFRKTSFRAERALEEIATGGMSAAERRRIMPETLAAAGEGVLQDATATTLDEAASRPA